MATPRSRLYRIPKDAALQPDRPHRLAASFLPELRSGWNLLRPRQSTSLPKRLGAGEDAPDPSQSTAHCSGARPSREQSSATASGPATSPLPKIKTLRSQPTILALARASQPSAIHRVREPSP